MLCVGVAACSGSVEVLSVDPVSHFHTLRYTLTLRLCTYRVTCWRVRVTIVAMEKQQCLLRIVELRITVSCIKTMGDSQKYFYEKLCHRLM
jgi:hypothetical protein